MRSPAAAGDSGVAWVQDKSGRLMYWLKGALPGEVKTIDAALSLQPYFVAEDAQATSVALCSVAGKVVTSSGSLEVLPVPTAAQAPAAEVTAFCCDDAGLCLCGLSDGTVITARPSNGTQQCFELSAKKSSGWWPAKWLASKTKDVPNVISHLLSLGDGLFLGVLGGSELICMEAETDDSLSVRWRCTIPATNVTSIVATLTTTMLYVLCSSAPTVFLYDIEPVNGRIVSERQVFTVEQNSRHEAPPGGNPSAPTRAFYQSIEAVGTRLAITYQNSVMFIPQTVDVSSPDSEDIHNVDAVVLACFAEQHSSALVLLTSVGWKAVSFLGNRVQQESCTDLLKPILQVEVQKVDAACLEASDSILKEGRPYPANWAVGDLDADDVNMLNHITMTVNARASKHHAFVVQLRASTSLVNSLAPQTLGRIYSSEELLQGLAAIRRMQNSESQCCAPVVHQTLKKAVLAVAARVRGPGVVASSAEVVFFDARNLVPLLEEVTKLALQTADSVVPLSQKLEQCIASCKAWESVLESVTSTRSLYPRLSEAAPFLWTHTSGGEKHLENICSIASDVLALYMEASSIVPQAENLVSYANTLHVSLDALLSSMFQIHSAASSIGSAALHRTLLRYPFVSTPFGYPFGAPKPRVASNALNIRIVETAERLAVTYSAFEVMYDFCCSDVIPRDTIEKPANQALLNRYCQQCPLFYAFCVTSFVRQMREFELEALPRIVTCLPALDRKRDEMLMKDAPFLHWVIDGSLSSVFSLLRDGQVPTGPFLLGPTPVEHRENCVALAELAWVAAGRPLTATRKIVDEARIVAAQKKFLPSMNKENFGPEQIVHHLVSTENEEAWVAASSIADAVLAEDVRTQLLQIALERAFSRDKATFDELVTAEGEGESMLAKRIGVTVTAQAVDASSLAKVWAVQSTAKGLEIFGEKVLQLLAAWIKLNNASRRVV